MKTATANTHWATLSHELLAKLSFYLFNSLCHNLNDVAIVEVRHWLVACGTLKEKLKCFPEGKSLAARSFAPVELVALLISEPGFKFFKNTALLVEDETFQLVGLESPMENKPPCFFVTRPSKTYKRVIVESVKRLPNRVETHLRLSRYVDIYDLVNPLEDLNDPNSVFSEQRCDLL